MENFKHKVGRPLHIHTSPGSNPAKLNGTHSQPMPHIHQYEEAVSSLILVKKELAKTRLALHRGTGSGTVKAGSAPTSGRPSFDGGKQHLSEPSIADFGQFRAVERIRLAHVRCGGGVGVIVAACRVHMCDLTWRPLSYSLRQAGNRCLAYSHPNTALVASAHSRTST